MEELKAMKKQLMSAAQSQMGNLERVNAKELGEVIDMIKDLEEAIYYCSIVKAMDESKEEKKDSEKYNEIATSLLARTRENQEPRYYTQPYYPMWLDPQYKEGRYNDSRIMYYSGGGNGGNSSNGGANSNMSNSSGGNNARGGGTRGFYGDPYMRDTREGRSGQTRRGYMEGKEQHQGKEKQIQELDKYMHELSDDITEMIEGASAEEKTLLQQKLSTLATKVANAV